MWHKIRYKTVLSTLIFVISFKQPLRSQVFNTFQHNSRPFVLNKCKDYKKSIRINLNKRLVPLKNYVCPLITDFRYATINNFTNTILYSNPIAYVRHPVALALKKVQEELTLKNFNLKFFDTYRPYSVTEKMWKVVPDERYAANPAKGSGHNRGVAIDVTLVKISTGEELPMPTDFDDFTEKAHHNYTHLPKEILENRALLKSTMEKYGFVALPTEWWHYSLPDANQYELLNLDFKDVEKCINE